MDLYKIVKHDRVLSFSNWRYRLLHWFFNINPKTPGCSPLPSYFYSHYCPLFWFTNLIALFIIPICVVKYSIYLVKNLIGFTIDVINICDKFIIEPVVNSQVVKNWKNKHKEKQEKKEDTQYNEKYKKYKLQKDKQIFINWVQDYDWGNFDILWKTFNSESDKSVELTKEEAEQIYNIHSLIKKKREEVDKSNKERKDQWMVFVINFSRLFFSIGAKVLWVGLLLLAAFLTYEFTFPFLNLIVSVSNFLWNNSVTIGIVVLSILVVVICVLTIAAVMSYVVPRLFNKFIQPILEMIREALADFTTYILAKLDFIRDFTSMFYKENCPAITVVEDISNKE